MTDIIEQPVQPETPATPAIAEPPAPDAWYNTIEDADLKGYTEKKGWKSPQDAISSYKNLEGKLGTAIHLPSETATPEEINAFYSKIGRPDSAEAYALPVPEGQDGEFSQQISKIMFDSGVPTKSAHALAEAWNAMQAQKAQEYEQSQVKLAEQQAEAIKKEWGAEYAKNEMIAKNAFKAFGVTDDQCDQLESVMGFDGCMKFFHNLGTKIGEDKFIGNHNGAGADKSTIRMTKEEANSEYQKLISDKDFYEKYRNGDAQAQAIMDNIWKYK